MKQREINLKGIDTILFDRDGVINKLRSNDYVKNWSEFEFIPEFLDIIKEISGRVKYVFIVTNQRGVGKGLMTEIDLQNIHNRMLSEIEKSGGRIDGIYYCTAVDTQDHNRKPNTGMWEQIIHDYPDVSPVSTIMIGDSESDIEFAKNCGIQWLKV